MPRRFRFNLSAIVLALHPFDQNKPDVTQSQTSPNLRKTFMNKGYDFCFEKIN
jgi:hypothetical protein